VVYVPTEKKLQLVFEYVDYDLKKYLSENKHSMTAYDIKLFMFQIINGLNYCPGESSTGILNLKTSSLIRRATSKSPISVSHAPLAFLLKP
jgi:serine/threonine protein kinase